MPAGIRFLGGKRGEMTTECRENKAMRTKQARNEGGFARTHVEGRSFLAGAAGVLGRCLNV